jgi:hypothetical protein
VETKAFASFLGAMKMPLRVVLPLLAIVLVGAIGAVFFLRGNIYARTLSDALDGARSVTFEEYSASLIKGPRDLVHQRIVASPQQIAALRKAISAEPPRDRGDEARCFMPHHRVIVVRADGSEFRLEVCFMCGNFRMTGVGGGAMPKGWIAPLKEFFTALGMPPLEDYTEKEENHPEFLLRNNELRALEKGQFVPQRK